MSIDKVNHPVARLVNAEVVAKSGGTYTSGWYDTNGWTDKVVTVDLDDTGTADVTIAMQVSNQGYYELNNKTITTDDYVSVTIIANLATETQVRYDSDDVDDLKHPIRSTRFLITNNEGTTATTVTVDIEGWS